MLYGPSVPSQRVTVTVPHGVRRSSSRYAFQTRFSSALKISSRFLPLRRVGFEKVLKLAELIKLIGQVFDDVLRLNHGEFFICYMTAAAQLLFQRIQRPNEVVLAGVDASIVASHAVSVMQALPVGAVAGNSAA